VFSKPRVTEQRHSIPRKGRGRGLDHVHKPICPLTSPISNRQHRQLKMETYLKARVRVLTQWVAGGRIGRRHCKVYRREGSKRGKDGEKSKSSATSSALILAQEPSTPLNPAHRPGTAHIKPLTLRTDHEHSINHHAQSVHRPSFTASIQSQHDKESISRSERPIRNTALSHGSEHSTN
jgi:hypothetical protein